MSAFLGLLYAKSIGSSSSRAQVLRCGVGVGVGFFGGASRDSGFGVSEFRELWRLLMKHTVQSCPAILASAFIVARAAVIVARTREHKLSVELQSWYRFRSQNSQGEFKTQS